MNLAAFDPFNKPSFRSSLRLPIHTEDGTSTGTMRNAKNIGHLLVIFPANHSNPAPCNIHFNGPQ